MRLALLSVALLAPLAGCTEDARFVEAHEADVARATVRLDGGEATLAPGEPGFDALVEEALHVLADVKNVHRSANSPESADGLANATENVELRFAQGVGNLPDYPHDREARSTRAIVFFGPTPGGFPSGNVFLCTDAGCGEWTSARDLDRLLAAARAVLDDASGP